MSAIDLLMDIKRKEDPKGDTVNVVLSGKFLAYKEYQFIDYSTGLLIIVRVM
ncbi:MAG: hypothetical protein ACJAYV_000055 [Oleispira sp.]|jgi:hypothetical protein